MKINRFAFPGLVEILPHKFKDSRGYFQVTYSERFMIQEGVTTKYIQDNESFSTKGVLRGMHFQKAPYAQGKLVRVLHGKVQDIVVDLRKESPTYKQWKSFILDSDLGNQVYVPVGFAHGFLALEDSIFSYKVTSDYNTDAECGIHWDDSDLNLGWIMNPLIISNSDKKLLSFEEALKI